jgi:hypothetical protein
MEVSFSRLWSVKYLGWEGLEKFARPIAAVRQD